MRQLGPQKRQFPRTAASKADQYASVGTGRVDIGGGLLLLLEHFSDDFIADYDGVSRTEVTNDLKDVREARKADVKMSAATWQRAAELAEGIGSSGAKRIEALALLVGEYAEDLADLYDDDDANPESDHERLRQAYIDHRHHRDILENADVLRVIDDDVIEDPPEYRNLDLSICRE